MKLVLFNDGKPGLMREDGIVDITEVIGSITSNTGHQAMKDIISNISSIKSDLEEIEKSGVAIPLSTATIGTPLPTPGKILCMGGNFTEFGHRQPGPMWGFLKASDSIIGPNETVVLPPDDANIFHHEAELVLVFGKAGKNVSEDEAFEYVFGYTCGVDVSARMPTPPGRTPPAFEAWRGISAHKSYNTFAPLGPCIVTKDEVQDPQNLLVQLRVDGQLRGNFNTSDMAHSIAKSIAFVSSFESFEAGDVLYTGTNHQGLGAMQDGETIQIDIEKVGGFKFTVHDPLKRKWPTGVDEETAQDVREGAGAPGRRKRPL
jgi:2-keto-4-pentenoate hydratase/2-oxohepta-3-ene-1,7-dioic acid hydratase in catechol pathway